MSHKLKLITPSADESTSEKLETTDSNEIARTEPVQRGSGCSIGCMAGIVGSLALVVTVIAIVSVVVVICRFHSSCWQAQHRHKQVNICVYATDLCIERMHIKGKHNLKLTTINDGVVQV